MNLLKDSYNSSSEEEINLATEELPIVPNSILNKYHIAPSTNIDNNKMNRGSSSATLWNTFIYLEWRPSVKDRRYLDKILRYYDNVMNQNGIRLKLDPLYWTELGSPCPLHISLSPNIRLRDVADRDRLFKRMELAIERSKLTPFEVKFDTVPKCVRSLTNPKSCFLTLPVNRTTRMGPITELFKMIEESEKGLNLDIPFDLKIAMTHMSISQMNPENGTTLEMSTINEVIQRNVSNFDIPSVTINSINIDKNRQSLSIRFPNN
ncbi:similar to Saccharomyces cerevisiae YLR132C Essential protein of unknown function [Maudiozyma barnettii]|uniref:U6 snRNA phosphodiesterase n=1 Tax=Maudiozyma barnettii TaxID=61262 RepID=A0A8H2VGM1_9SACH|nr:phosphoric diester hydrolase [Kazachstania barnettii]CAB4254819.1 similar to Saccharomyces cerevisiae YLR132C Essential protein of unknown function [Kazachstania barnettii]CAD1782999.1 similar to Saccharomyces cerevisiae YLR132C Essential protein of unknown function [Kazachstania barnettii]